MQHCRLLLAALLLVGCASLNSPSSSLAIDTAPPDITATNAFYYYADVEAAWVFYRDVLGLETVIDYGFAKILRVADSAYLTLVQASEGMHTADEPKTVTLNLVTDELSRWSEHLSSQSVPMRVAYGGNAARDTNSFVAVDPEGYFLKFVRFNPHPNHESFVAAFAAAPPLNSAVQHAAGRLSIRAAAFSIYVESLSGVRAFYQALFDVAPAGQISGVDVYQMSNSGFLLLVEGSDGLHQATARSGVTYSFFTSDVDAWYARAARWPGFELRTPEVLDEDGMVRVFVGYDPVGTFLEWDTFQDVPENARLFRYLP
ncbi:MAG: hypothetical protein ACR2Q3_06015 [Woeseiaceae bacterium]